MKKPRFQFGLRFFLVATVVCAFVLTCIWEKVNQPQVFRSNANVLGTVTYGDVESLEELSLTPAQALRSINRHRANNAEMQKQIASDVIWQSVEIEPLESVLQPPRIYPLIGPALIRKRDFRCSLEGVDSAGKDVSAIVIVNRNHLHAIEID